MATRGKQLGVATALPYSQQIGPQTVITYEGDLTETIQLQGIPFETLDHDDLNARSQTWFANMTSMCKDGQLALWTHIVRQKISYDMSAIEYDNAFSTMFAKEYAAKFDNDDQFHNELFISPVVRMGSTKMDRWGAKLSKQDGEVMQTMRADALDRLEQVSAKLMGDLRQYHPRVLSTYDQEGVTCTELGQFYSRLLNAEKRHIPLKNAELSYQVQSAGLEFGHETIEIVGAAGSRYAAILGLVAPYTTDSINCKVFEGLLSAPFEFVLSQSVTVMPFNQADKLLDKQITIIKSTSSNADQIKDIETARRNLQNGKFTLFNHEFLLVIYGDSIKALNKNVNAATSILDQKTIGTARLRAGALITAYWNILPANFKHGRPREMPISSDNFTKFFPMHNFSIGNALGSQWGMPIAMLKTKGMGPYFFNYHVARSALIEQGMSLEYEEAGEGDHRKEVGHYRILGQTGSGKTVIKLGLRALARKAAARNGKKLRTFSFDLHRGEEIMIRAIGGSYHRFEAGQYTNIKPFSMPNAPEHQNMIFRLGVWCAQHGGGFRMAPDDEDKLYRSIKMVYDLPERDRRFARILDNIPDSGKHGLRASLGRWVDGGPFAWILDSEENGFDLRSANDWGFDITSFLDIDAARQPILMCLTHMMSHVASGSPHIIDIAEAWRAIQDPMMRAYIEETALTVRRKDGVIGLDTQEPEHLCAANLGPTLATQFPTQLLLPNAKAKAEAYIDGLGLTVREFNLVKNTREGQGYVLIKKGVESTLAQMNLAGMNNMLAVLSTSQDNLEILDELRSQRGDDPANWLPEFFKRRV